jgi:hypothetical protein
MIVVKLMGGLGNQMFQYAFAKNLAIKNRTSLKLDLSFLLDKTPREHFIFRDFDLDIFSFNYEIIKTKELIEFLNYQDKSFLKKIKSRFIDKTVYLKENKFHFEKENLFFSKNIYIDGYWQSEKYFSDIGELIRNEFSFIYKFSESEQKLNNNIISSNSICINYRRTDYVNSQKSIETHGFIGEEYYDNAINSIVEKVENPCFYIFSDDIEWCIENVKIDYPTVFVDHSYKGIKFSSYLQLMKNCKHFIIPNSTFAWWAAWLSENENKIIICPKNWFKDINLQNQSEDIIPLSWMKI